MLSWFKSANCKYIKEASYYQGEGKHRPGTILSSVTIHNCCVIFRNLSLWQVLTEI